MIKQTILEIYFDISHKGTILVSTLTLSLAESAHFVSDHNEPREHWGRGGEQMGEQTADDI